LNVNVGGRFLFAGSLTSTKPVADADYSTAPTYSGTFTTVAEPSFYYQGNDTKLSARLNEGLDVQYGVTANDPAFEKLIRAVRIVRSTATNDPDIIAKFSEAARLLNDAQDGLKSVELNIGTKIEQSGRTEQTLKTTKAFLEGTISDFESADTFTAVAELTQDQTMLEASYNVLVRLSNLSLNNFLN
jgi:flagellar hook-associated protein 3 FlgL